MALRSRSNLNKHLKPTTLSYRKLPTYVDIFKHYHSLKPCSHKLAVKQTVLKIIDIWNRASIPTFSRAYITSKLKRYINIVNNIKKSINNVHFGKIVAVHKQKYDILFDICPCKCIATCKCRGDCRVPTAERSFLEDQRTSRCSTIDSSSTTSTSIQSRKAIDNAHTST